MKKGLLFIFVLAVALACSACDSKEPNPAGISKEEFKRIDMGMTLSEAQEIFGGSAEKGTVEEISEKNTSGDGYYEVVHVYKVTGETTGYAELEFTYHLDHKKLIPSIDGLTAKSQYDLS